MGLSFRTRLLVSFWAIFILGLSLASVYYQQALRQSTLTFAKDELTRQLTSIELLMKDQQFQNSEALQAWIRNLGETLKFRITCVAAGGQVIEDSEVPVSEIPTLGNFASRPEIREASESKVAFNVYSDGRPGADMLYAAKRVALKSTPSPVIIRLALPISRTTAVPGYTGMLIAAMALILLAGWFLSVWLTRRHDRSVKAMAESAEAIGTGDFSRRVGYRAPPELFPAAYAIDRMAERIESRLLTITGQKQQLEAILNGMEDGVMLLDPRGRIHTVNRAFKNMASKLSQITGRRPLEVIRSPELQEACERILSTPEVEGEEPPRERITLELDRTYEVNVLGVQQQQNGNGAIVVFHDVTELRRLSKVRQDFVMNVSHEMRTPLTSIRGYAETLLESEDCRSETTQSFLRIITRNANHMSKMVTDLLDLAKLEASARKISFGPVDAGEALMAAWKTCSGLAQAKEVKLDDRITPQGLLVTGDYDELTQLFRNLLENAIRYSPPGESVTASCRIEEGTATFEIRDKGPGIPKADQPRVFERFYRVEKHRDSSSGTTGLGLAISRHIVINHGGKIWLESPPKDTIQGTAFYFTLSVAKEEPQSDEI